MRSIFVLSALVAGCDSDEGAGPQQTTPDAALVVVDAGARQVVMETKPLQAGELVETILTGGAGDTAIITLSAPVAKLDWNIHGHPPGMSTITVYEEFAVMTAHYTFAPTKRADWYILLRNKHNATMDVQVKLELFGDMQWGGW